MQTILIDLPENVKDFLLMEDSVYKNILWNRSFRGVYVKVDIFKTEDKLCFSSKEYSIAKSTKSFYLRQKSNKGFTLDSKGKLQLWFGSNVSEMINLDKLFTFLKLNWVNDESSWIYSYFTKSGLERILNGKTTNPIDFCKHYLKVNRINASPVFMYKACKFKHLAKNHFLQHAYCAKDINHFLERWADNYSFNSIWSDTVQQAMILGVKIDFKWSDNRIKEEHSNYTKELMKAEIDNIPNYIIEYPFELPELPSEFELLTTQKRVFEEGVSMNHCIYTNYWNEIKNLQYIVFHVQLGIEEVTFGCNLTSEGLRYNQCYRKNNASPSEEMIDFVRNWLDNNKFEFCKVKPSQLAFAC